jgi:hypothetical protein
MTANMISIRFIRREDAFGDNGHNDDYVTITCVGEDQYKLIFTTSDLHASQALMLKDREVFRWMRTVLGLLEADGDPFANIQIDQHALPSILIPVAQMKNGIIHNKIGQYYSRILDAVEFFLDTAQPTPQKKKDNNDYNYPVEEEADEDNGTEEYEEEYADMPPPARHMFFDEDGNLQRAYY